MSAEYTPLIKINADIESFLRISVTCKNCKNEIILQSDVFDKEYLTCGNCKKSCHLRSNVVQYLKDLIFEFDKSRKLLNQNGFELFIQGKPDLKPRTLGRMTIHHTDV